MKRAYHTIWLAVLLAACATTSAPQGRGGALQEAMKEGDRCLAANDPKGAIAAYGYAIDLSPGSALAWFWRGQARVAADDPAGAAADFSKAIEINLADATAWFHRGKARQAQGDNAGAIDDYTHALSIRTAGEFFRARGHAKFCAGDLAGAIADLDEAAHSQKDGLQLDYTELELGAARLRNRQRAEAVEGLKRHFRLAKRTTESAWPRQIASFLEGELPEPEFLLTARSSEEPTRRERVCEATFYAAIARDAAGDEPGAIPLFRECLENAIPGFVEPDMARAELKRLGAEK
ncbi:MAG: tetratricopeptide repeat protein [Planctomycetes bacterium]|nr:tetratricopeptide repeat protein [Planctomycetota bacterium]